MGIVAVKKKNTTKKQTKIVTSKCNAWPLIWFHFRHFGDNWRNLNIPPTDNFVRCNNGIVIM